MPIRICLAGATGWVGRALTLAIHESPDFELVAAVGKRNAGKNLGEILLIPELNIRISKNLKDGLSMKPDVFIDYTHPSVVRDHVLTAIQSKTPVVIGTSGLTEHNFSEINESASKNNVGVLAAGNFAITAVLLQKFALITAQYVSQWEILDYAEAKKPDAPSGTARELASKLSQIKNPVSHHPIEQTYGQKESRGATVNGSQIHSIRLPGYIFGFEIVFGQENERLRLYHEAGSGAEPYVNGTLLAARKVSSFVGLKRGLDAIMEF